MPVFTSRMCAPASCCSTPCARMYDMSCSFNACLNLFLPVGLIRSPISTGVSPILTAWVYDETTERFFFVISTGFKSFAAFLNAFIYSGVVPQHPPIIRSPFLQREAMASAYSSTETLNTVLPFTVSGSPALGCIIIGTLSTSSSLSAAGSSCFGPNEQFIPIASAPMPSSIAAIAYGSAPDINLESEPYTFETNTGRVEFSLTARSAAFVSSESFMVSIITRSTPYFTPSFTVCANIFTHSSNSRSPNGFNILPVGPISRAMNLGSLLSVRFRALSAFITAFFTISSSSFSSNFNMLAPNVFVVATLLPASKYDL